MQTMHRWMATTALAGMVAGSMALSGCGGGSGGAGSPTAGPATPNVPADGAGGGSGNPTATGFCADLTVDFAGAPSARATDLPGSLKFLVKDGDSRLSLFSQVGLAARSPGIQSSPVIPRGQGFTTIHGNLINSDQVDLTIPGHLALQWTVEPNLYQPEGVTAGDAGYYGTHVFPVTGTDIDFSMIALHKTSGARRWVVRPGQIGQGGTPLVLNDPATGGKQVFSGGLRGVFALDEDGKVSWCTNTGLGVDAEATSDFDTHIKKRLWGINYHRPTDSVIAVYGDGTVLAFARENGTLRARTRIDGDPSVDNSGLNLPEPILAGAETAMRKQFIPEGAQLPEDARVFDTIISVALGGDMVVSNYYATDPDSDRIWIAATLPDRADGEEDGVARFGALHALTLTGAGDDYRFANDCSIPFEGGSASTPALLPGGERIYTSDNEGHALAFNQRCELIWSVDVGDQILGSLAVSPYDHQVYAATGSGVFQIIDRGTTGELGWSARLDDIFQGGPLLLPVLETVTGALGSLGLSVPAQLQASNIEIAAISENALVLMAGLGVQMDPERSEVFAPLVMSLTAVDRLNGEILHSTPAREESIAVIGVDDDGAVTIGNSPLRRAGLVGATEVLGDGLLGKALAGLIPPLTGGVSKYAPAGHHDLAARDAVCYAARKVLAWEVNRDKVDYAWSRAPESTAYAALSGQGRAMLGRALAEGALTSEDYSALMFAVADADERLRAADYRGAHARLSDACQRLQ